MRSKLFLVFVMLVATQVFSQDKKWSLEANYPFSVGDENSAIEDLNGILDLGLKYRFSDLGFMKLGGAFNASLFADSRNFRFSDGNEDNLLDDYRAKIYLLQPKVFAEFRIPFAQKLKPFVALGYSVTISDYYYFRDNDVIIDDTSTDGGFNANLGLSYDITKSFFIQAQYDFLTQQIENEDLGLKRNSNTNLIKVGLGLRF